MMICGDCAVADDAAFLFYAYMMELTAFINARMDLVAIGLVSECLILLEVISR